MSRFSIEHVHDRRAAHEALFADLRVVGLQRLAQEAHLSTETPRSYTRPLMIWVTRGQGLITLGNTRRGFGTNSIIFIPAGQVHGIDVPTAMQGHALFLPDDRDLAWPEEAILLRCRDGDLMAEIMTLMDLVQRIARISDDQSARAATHAAGLISVFLARHRLSGSALPAFASTRGPESPD